MSDNQHDTSDAPTRNADVAQLSFEAARDELVAVVSQLESGGITLEASLELWERGEALAARCQQWLDQARERLAASTTPAASKETSS